MKTDNYNGWDLVLNPFYKIAGWKASLLGAVIVVATVVIGYYCDSVFYGLSMKFVPDVSWPVAFGLQGIGLAVLFVLMYATALIFARGVRFQDILGTVLLSRYPFLISALTGYLIDFSTLVNIPDKIAAGSNITWDVLPILAVGFLMIFFIVVHVIILYRGFVVSTGLKGSKATLLFALIMLISEIITNAIVFSILPF